MEQLDTKNMSKLVLERQIELTEQLLKLDHQQWKQLGLYQSFHQTLFKVALELNLKALQSQKSITTDPDELESLEQRPSDSEYYFSHLERPDLLDHTQKNIEPELHLLFTLTAGELIDELCHTDWLKSQDSELTLHPNRWYQLQKQVKVTTDGALQIDISVSDHLESNVRVRKSRQEEQSITARRAERLRKSLEYIDPLQHISKGNETPFTIRRLDLILTNLDGLVIKQESFRELLNLNLHDFDLIFDATDRLGLTRRTDDGYVRLDFHGISLARQDRPKRLKALSMIASRFRREAKLHADS